MTEGEREMLLGDAGRDQNPAPRKRSRAKRLLVGAFGLIVALALVVWLAGPAIAAALAPREIAIEVAGRPARLLLGDLGLSWNGPQKAGAVRIVDEGGQQMADLAINADTRLLSALWSGELGTIELSGALDVREQQITPTPGPVAPPVRPGAAPALSTGVAKPIRLPTGFHFALHTKNLSVSYTPVNAAPIQIKGLDVSLTYDRGSTVVLTAKSASPVAAFNVNATDLIKPGGDLDLHSAKIDLAASATLPGALVDSLVAAFLPGANSAQAPGAAPSPDTRLAAAAQVRAGRLSLTGPASPIILQTPLPNPVIALMNQGDSPARVTQAPVYTFTAHSLDLPISAGTGGLDLRGAALELSVKSTEARAQIQFAQGETPRPVVISPWQAALNAKDFATGITASGDAKVTVDGAAAGSIRLSADATGLLDGEGRLTSNPGAVRAELHLDQTPVGLFEPLVAGRNFSLTEVLGPMLTGIVSVQTKTQLASDPGQAPLPAPPGQFEFTAQATSSHMDLWTVLVTDGDRIWSEGRAARVELDQPGPAIRAVLAEHGIAASGAGLIISEIHDLDLPLVSLAPDLSRASASLRLAFGDITVQSPAIARPLEITSIQTNVDIAAGPLVGAAIDYRLKSGQAAVTASGQLNIVDLASRSTGGPPWVEFTPQRARPVGSIRIAGLPPDALGLLPHPWGSAARESLGEALAGTLEFTAAEGTRDIGVNLSLTGAGAVATGRFVLDDHAVRSVGEGLIVELKSPEPLARAAMAATPGAEVRWQSPLRISVRDVTLPRNGDLAHVAAAARVDASNVAVRFAPQAQWIQTSALAVDASLAQGGVAKLALDGTGVYEGSDFQARGEFTVPGALPTGAGFDFAALKPEGALTLTGIPGSLARLAPGDVGAVASEALGDRFDLTISAPAPESKLASLSGKPGPSARVDLKGQLLSGSADARLLGKDIWVGPVGAELRATPSLVASVDRLLEAQGTLPTLQQPARLRLDMQPVAVAMGENGALDLNTLRPVMVMLRADDDVVLGNLPIGPESAPRSVGLRGLTLGAAYHRNQMTASEGSVKAVIFDPADSKAPIAEIDVVSGLTLPRPAAITAHIAKIDTARLDRLLARPGLTTDALGSEAGFSLVGATAGAGQPLTYRFSVRSPKLSADGAMVELRDRIQLAAPLAVTWEAPAAWLNAHVLAPAAPGAAAAPMAFMEDVKITAEVRTLVLGNPGLFTPGVFAVHVRASAPAARFITDKQDRFSIEGITFSLAPGASPAQLAFSLTNERQTIQQRGDRSATTLKPLNATGVLDHFADASGAFDAESLSITATISGHVATARLDSFSDSDGLLIDLLGSVASVNIQSKNLSRTAGTLTAHATTPNADADIQGAIEDEQFVSTAPGRITLRRITPELSARVFETVIPILTRLEKTEADKPGAVDARDLTIPLDGDVSQLNGKIRVDLGTVQFQTSDLIGQLIKATGNRAQGSLGRSVKPFDFVIANGVVAYDRIELPVGEFTFVTSGTVDLVNKKMDIVTYVPILAIADEVVKITQFAPGVAMVPIRTKGNFGNTRSEIALDKLFDEGIPGAAVGGAEGLIGGIGSAIEQALSKKKEEDKAKKEKKKQKKQAKKEAEQNK